ncbi:MAG: DapH/DapD/GlmU-related protein [Promethearchaeota archaeon]
MSSVIPTGLKVGPSTTNTLAANRYLVLYILLIWLSIFPEFFLLIQIIARFEITLVYFFLILPLYLFCGYLLLVFSSLFWSWLFLKLVCMFHRPKEGYFERSMKDKDYRFWSLRAVIKKYPIWIIHNAPFPWLDTIAFKLFGNQVSFSTPTYDAWIDSEFVDIGHGTTIGQGSVIMTSMITAELLIIKRVKIGNNCLVGAHSVVSPGTQIRDNTILGALSSTTFGQELEANWVYMGTPAVKYRPSKFRDQDDLTSEERAKQKTIKEVDTVIAENEVLKGRKTPIAYYQLKKQVYKGRRAQKHLEKAQVKRDKGQRRLDKAEWRAEKQEFKADKKQQQSLHALDIAKSALEKKIQKERQKLIRIEERERRKVQEDRENEKERNRIRAIKEKLFRSYEKRNEESESNRLLDRKTKKEKTNSSQEQSKSGDNEEEVN